MTNLSHSAGNIGSPMSKVHLQACHLSLLVKIYYGRHLVTTSVWLTNMTVGAWFQYPIWRFPSLWGCLIPGKIVNLDIFPTLLTACTENDMIDISIKYFHTRV